MPTDRSVNVHAFRRRREASLVHPPGRDSGTFRPLRVATSCEYFKNTGSGSELNPEACKTSHGRRAPDRPAGTSVVRDRAPYPAARHLQSRVGGARAPLARRAPRRAVPAGRHPPFRRPRAARAEARHLQAGGPVQRQADGRRGSRQHLRRRGGEGEEPPGAAATRSSGLWITLSDQSGGSFAARIPRPLRDCTGPARRPASSLTHDRRCRSRRSSSAMRCATSAADRCPPSSLLVLLCIIRREYLFSDASRQAGVARPATARLRRRASRTQASASCTAGRGGTPPGTRSARRNLPATPVRR